MKIRQAIEDDVPALIAMAQAFVETTAVYGRLFKATPESLEHLARLLFQFGDQAAILLACEDEGPCFGMLAIVASPHPISGALYADEVVWWIDPSHRGAMRAGPKLLRAAENWARDRNCNMVKMVAPHGSTVGRFYERLGYEPVESAYAKVL